MLSTSDVRTYVSEFSYDSWNRIRQIKYPDGEVLTYGYDAAGQLTGMVSKKDNTSYTLLEDMKYDQYGNVTYKKYGNGTESVYTYDPKRHHLTSMVATNSQGEFINAAYTYDKVDNILGIKNTAKPVSTIGGTYSHSYTYEGDWFFFHTDHLGSTSYLTDTAGNVSQFVCYTPYGEAIVDEHLTTYENPFKFSGKELDDITGLYDHGLGQETRYPRCGMGWTQGMGNFRRCLHSRTAVGIRLG